MTDAARVRYAPRPVTEQHIGDVYTALFSYLYARKMGGTWVLYMGSAGVEPSQPSREEAARRELAWLGLYGDPNTRPVDLSTWYRDTASGALRQTAQDAARLAARYLVDGGHAYWDHSRMEEHRARGGFAICDGWRVLRLASSGMSYLGSAMFLDDLLCGEILIPMREIGDFPLYVASGQGLWEGYALPNLAAAVADQAWGITHVLQGKERLLDAARQLLLHRVLGQAAPRFGHLPEPVTLAGIALSQATENISIRHYEAEGYLPQALLAYAATLGDPSLKHAERLSLDDLVEQFDPRRLTSHPPIFDSERLLWFNKQRLRGTGTWRIAALLKPRLEAAYGAWERSQGTAHTAERWYALLVSALQEECATLEQMAALSRFCFIERVDGFTEEARQALEGEGAREVLAYCLEALNTEIAPDVVAIPDAAAEFYQQMRHHFRDTAGLRGRQVMYPIRAALTGTMTGPCLGIVTSLLGLSRCRQRLRDSLR